MEAPFMLITISSLPLTQINIKTKEENTYIVPFVLATLEQQPWVQETTTVHEAAQSPAYNIPLAGNPGPDWQIPLIITLLLQLMQNILLASPACNKSFRFTPKLKLKLSIY